MLYLNSYIRISAANSPFTTKGKFIDALITSAESPEFKLLLEKLDKPLYAIRANVKIAMHRCDERTDDRVTVRLSESAERLIFCGDQKIERRSKTKYGQQIKICVSPDILVIPVFNRAVRVGLTDISDPMNFFESKEALFYTKDQPEGFVDTSLMSEPLNILDGRSSGIESAEVVTDRQIIDALWSIRSKVNLKRVYTSKVQFWNEMFVVDGDKKNYYVGME